MRQRVVNGGSDERWTAKAVVVQDAAQGSGPFILKDDSLWIMNQTRWISSLPRSWGVVCRDHCLTCIPREAIPGRTLLGVKQPSLFSREAG